MNPVHHDQPDTRVIEALAHASASTRLRAALWAGSNPHPHLITTLVDRCGHEPDFFVRDMLTWALVRHPKDVVVPLLVEQLHSSSNQARSQSLHTLSKIGDPATSSAITTALLHDADDEVARSAWRASVELVAPESSPHHTG